jgi:hypothetical protein
MELNREQIIKALECFHDRILNSNLAEKITEVEMMATIDAVALIKELTEENERVNALLLELCAENIMLCGDVKQAKSATVRETRERLTTFFAADDILKYVEVDAEYINSQIDRITKEMEKNYNEKNTNLI